MATHDSTSDISGSGIVWAVVSHALKNSTVCHAEYMPLSLSTLPQLCDIPLRTQPMSGEIHKRGA
jgi:hypothetical protein